MEEEKAAAYYDELTRRGEGAARFKQGLGFSATTGDVPARGSALPSSSSSFLSNFVKASSTSTSTQSTDLDKQAQLESIQNKLSKNKREKLSPTRESEERHQPRVSRRRSRSRDRDRDRDRNRQSSRRSRSRERYSDRDRDRRRSRSRSRSDSDRDRRRRGRRSRSRSRNRNRRAERRSRSRSPRERRSEKERGRAGKERNGGVDYSRLIEGYENMTPAERVKAKIKLQLAETVEKDATKGMGLGWERFEFNKDAPLDDEGDVEAADDDTALVKHIGQSFRFSAVQSKREDQIRAAHDEAMFGASVILPSSTSDDEADAEAEIETKKEELNESDLAASLLSEKILAKQQGSWRDRARKQRN